MSNERIVDDLISRYPVLKVSKQEIINVIRILIKAYNHNNKLLVCGNGGSAADALHMVGELMKSFILPRRLDAKICKSWYEHSDNPEYLINNLQLALPAISLVSETALSTAYSNDNVSDLVFAQQVIGYGKAQDVFLGISTSGNSKNVIYAAEVAKALGLKVIGLTGITGGNFKNKCDVCICVPESETYKVQELHLPIYHAICSAVEEYFYGEM